MDTELVFHLFSKVSKVSTFGNFIQMRLGSPLITDRVLISLYFCCLISMRLGIKPLLFQIRLFLPVFWNSWCGVLYGVFNHSPVDRHLGCFQFFHYYE